MNTLSLTALIFIWLKTIQCWGRREESSWEQRRPAGSFLFAPPAVEIRVAERGVSLAPCNCWWTRRLLGRTIGPAETGVSVNVGKAAAAWRSFLLSVPQVPNEKQRLPRRRLRIWLMPGYSDLSSACTCPLLLPLLLIAEAQRTLVVAARLGSPRRRLTRWSAVRRRLRRSEWTTWWFERDSFPVLTPTQQMARSYFQAAFSVWLQIRRCYWCILSFCNAMQSRSIAGKHSLGPGHCGHRHQTLMSCDVCSINITTCKSCELQRRVIGQHGLLRPWEIKAGHQLPVTTSCRCVCHSWRSASDIWQKKMERLQLFRWRWKCNSCVFSISFIPLRKHIESFLFILILFWLVDDWRKEKSCG